MVQVKLSPERYTPQEKRLRPNKPTKTLKHSKNPKGVQKTGHQNPRLALFGADKKNVLRYLLWLSFCVFLVILGKLAIGYVTSVGDKTDDFFIYLTSLAWVFGGGCVSGGRAWACVVAVFYANFSDMDAARKAVTPLQMQIMPTAVAVLRPHRMTELTAVRARNGL